MLKNSNNSYCLFGRDLLIPFFCFLFLSSVLYADSAFVYDSKGKRNPFIPLVTMEGRLLKLDKQETATGSLAIEGIIYDKNGYSFAIVSGTVVGIGDSVGDYRVLKIYGNKVIFIKDGEPFEVEFTKTEA